MPEEKKCKADRGDNPGPAYSRDFEFEISTNDSEQQQQRRECSDPKGDLLEAGWFDRDDVAFESGFFGQIGNRIGYALREQRFAIDPFSRFLGIESKHRARAMNNAVADFYFFVLVHERLGDVGIVSIFDRGTTDEGRPI